MKKVFNTTGICIAEKHYMVDTTDKINSIVTDLIAAGKYFTMNRARQYGKTTTLFLLEKKLQENYLVVSISFEAADDLFVSHGRFVKGFVMKLERELKRTGINTEILSAWCKPVNEEMPFEDLSNRITDLCQAVDKKMVLMIDEVDKSSDNQIFLSFLSLLRDKYLDVQKGKDISFYSVILAGVSRIMQKKR